MLWWLNCKKDNDVFFPKCLSPNNSLSISLFVCIMPPRIDNGTSKYLPVEITGKFKEKPINLKQQNHSTIYLPFLEFETFFIGFSLQS